MFATRHHPASRSVTSTRNSDDRIPDSTIPHPTSDIPDPASRTSFYDKTTPKERQKINHAIVNRMPATYKGIYSFFNLKSKGIHYFAFYRYARKLRDSADAALVTDLVAPNALESPKLIMRLAARECVDALLHPEEDGSARKLSRNQRVYSHFRRQELAAERTAATIEVARIRAGTQRDCTRMRTDAQRDVADLRTQCADHMNERRIKTQRDAVQFKADCAAARARDYYRFKRGHPFRTDSPQPPPPPSAPPLQPSVGCIPDAPSSASPSPRSVSDADPGAPATGSPAVPATRSLHTEPGAQATGSPHDERSATSEISNLQSEIPPVSDPPNECHIDMPGLNFSMVELIPNSARFVGTVNDPTDDSFRSTDPEFVDTTTSAPRSAPNPDHALPGAHSHTSAIPHPTSDIPPHPAFAGNAAPFGRRADGTKRSHLEYWIRLKQRCREILKMPEQDKDWPPDISEALAVRPPELAAQRLREVLKRRSASTLDPSNAGPDAAGVGPPFPPASEPANAEAPAV